MKLQHKNSGLVAILLIATLALTGCGGADNEKYMKDSEKTAVTETSAEVKLTDYVKGLKDWTVEVGAKNVDFLDGVTFDKKVVKSVKVDDSKVNLAKEGKYELVYSIVPVDDSLTKETVKKTVTVNVVSAKEAQAEADKGNQVVTSDNEVKKDSQGNTPAPKKDNSSGNSGSNSNAGNSNGGSDSSSSNNGNNSNSGNNSNAGSNAGNTGNSSNAGNSNADNSKPADKPSEPAHSHNWEYVAAVTHTEYKTETYTEQVPHYDYVCWYECKGCGAKFDNDTECSDHCLFECKTNYEFKKGNVQNGYDTVTKERQVPYEVTDSEAYYKCSCGATK